MTVVDLCKAALDDADAIARIQVETWRMTYAGILPDELLIRMSKNRQRRMWRRMMRGGETIQVARDPAAGVIGFGSYGPNRSDRDGFSGEIYTLYVAPDFQGIGIGRGLLRAMFGSLTGEGHDSALVWVLAENPNRFFYEAQGGQRIAERSVTMWGAQVRELAYGWTSTHALPPARV